MARTKAAEFTDTELLDFVESQGNGWGWVFDVVGWSSGAARLENSGTADLEYAGKTARMAIAKAIARHAKWPLGRARFGVKSRAKKWARVKRALRDVGAM